MDNPSRRDMHEDILSKLELRIGRRGFLRGSGLVVAALGGITVGVPASSYGQDPPHDDKKQGDKPQDDRQETDRPPDDTKDDKGEKKGEKKQDDTANDPYKIAHVDANGREYRL